MDPTMSTEPNAESDPEKRHISRYRPGRNWSRIAIFAGLIISWTGLRAFQDMASMTCATAPGQRESAVDRLVEADYVVVAIPTPFEVIVARENETGDREQARVRLLGIRRPWQWNNDSERWNSDARAAIAEWIAAVPVRVRLSRRQVSDDGVLLAHLQRNDVLLSDHLVRQGWMTVDANIDPSDGAIRSLYRAQEEARLAARGIWSGRALGMMNYPGM